MDAATIQQKIYTGYGKASLRTGYEFDIQRPSVQSLPAMGASSLGCINASFTINVTGFQFQKAGAYKDVLWNGLFDGSQTQVGDYLVSDEWGTYFVAAQQALLPILCVKCSRTLNVYKPGPGKVFGATSTYGGTDPADESLLMYQWPGSVIFDARGRATEVALPTDLPSPFYQILLPAVGDVDIRSSCFITDDLNRRYTVAAAEKSALGWRISAQQAVT